jgi:hypothetical protein
MSTIVRYEFLGSWLLFWALGISVIGIPLAILYLVNGTVRVEHQMDDPERFIEDFRARSRTKKD